MTYLVVFSGIPIHLVSGRGGGHTVPGVRLLRVWVGCRPLYCRRTLGPGPLVWWSSLMIRPTWSPGKTKVFYHNRDEKNNFTIIILKIQTVLDLFSTRLAMVAHSEWEITNENYKPLAHWSVRNCTFGNNVLFTVKVFGLWKCFWASTCTCTCRFWNPSAYSSRPVNYSMR